MAEEILRLGLYESKAILPLISRGPGTFTQKMFTEGNSILSTVFVQSLDVGASVSVKYYDFTTGGDVGESYLLQSHETIVSSLTDDRQLITKMHNKPYVVATVTGGNAIFGVYVTVVVSQASDIDSALKKENQSVDLVTDKVMPIMFYDTSTGVWRFARGEAGIQDVRVVGNVAIGDPGTPVFVDSAGLTTPGSQQTLASYTVPVTKILSLLSAQVICRQESTFEVLADSVVIGSGRTGPASPNVNFSYRVARQLPAGTLVEVKATARSGSGSADIECYIQGTLSI